MRPTRSSIVSCALVCLLGCASGMQVGPLKRALSARVASKKHASAIMAPVAAAIVAFSSPDNMQADVALADAPTVVTTEQGGRAEVTVAETAELIPSESPVSTKEKGRKSAVKREPQIRKPVMTKEQVRAPVHARLSTAGTCEPYNILPRSAWLSSAG